MAIISKKWVLPFILLMVASMLGIFFPSEMPMQNLGNLGTNLVISEPKQEIPKAS